MTEQKDESISPAPPRGQDAGGFMLFANGYYALGGWRDYQGRFVSLDAAKGHLERLVEDDALQMGIDNAHIVCDDRIVEWWHCESSYRGPARWEPGDWTYDEERSDAQNEGD